MTKGRKRKTGRRLKSGRLARPIELRIVKGNDKAEAMKAIYGQDGCDAIGRAYRAGLLGEGNDAKKLLDTARSIARAYWAWYANGPIRCTLGDRNGAAVIDDRERERKQEEWLRHMLTLAGRGGSNERTLFDQLCINIEPDCGPAWLDRIIANKAMMSDHARLGSALASLHRCAGTNPVAMLAKTG